MKIAVSGGHGPNTPGKRTPDGYKEAQFNHPTANYVIQYLQEYENVQILRVFETSRDVPLAERTSKANSWGANLYLSIHYNAAGPGSWYDAADGIETLVYSKSSNNIGYKVGTVAHNRLIAAAKRDNRGVKARPDLWEMRATHMPAVLFECGFMTNRAEAALMKQDSYRRLCARAIVDGVADYYNLKKKKVAAPPKKPAAAPKPGTLFKVQIGAFSSKLNADRLEKRAENAGFKDAYVFREGGLYKVQIGAFSSYDNAKRTMDLARSRGFAGAWINQ